MLYYLLDVHISSLTFTQQSFHRHISYDYFPKNSSSAQPYLVIFIKVDLQLAIGPRECLTWADEET